MHSVPLRPAVRAIRSGTSMAMPRRRVNSTQALACQGMESIMVPSMSKMKASTGIALRPGAVAATVVAAAASRCITRPA